MRLIDQLPRSASWWPASTLVATPLPRLPLASLVASVDERMSVSRAASNSLAA